MATETEIERLVLRLVTDVEGYLGPLKEAMQASKTAATTVQKAAKQIEKLGDSLQQYGKKLSLYVTAPLIGLGTAATAAWSIQETAEIRLRGLLEANGRAVRTLYADYDQYARSLQRLGIAGDEATLKLLQQAEALGVTGEDAKRAVKEAYALASAMDMSSRAGIRYAAMLAQGDTIMLQRYIPTLRMIDDQEEKVAEAHRMLGNMFAVAEANAATFQGQLKQLWWAIGDLGETIGQVIAEHLKPFVVWFRGAAESLQTLTPQMRELIVVVGGIAASVGPMLIGLGTALKLISVAMSGFTALNPVVLAIAGATAAVAALTAGLVYLQAEFGLFDPVIEAAQNFWRELKNAVGPELERVWKQVKMDLVPALKDLGREAAKAASEMIEAMAPLLELGGEAMVQSLQGWVSMLKVVVLAAERLANAVALVADNWERAMSLRWAGLAGMPGILAPETPKAPGEEGSLFGGWDVDVWDLSPVKQQLEEVRTVMQELDENYLEPWHDATYWEPMIEGFERANAELEWARSLAEKSQSSLGKVINQVERLNALREDLGEPAYHEAVEAVTRQVQAAYETPFEAAQKQIEDLNQLLAVVGEEQFGETYRRAAKAALEEFTKAAAVPEDRYVSQGVQAIRRGTIQEAVLRQEHRVAMMGPSAEQTIEKQQLEELRHLVRNTDPANQEPSETVEVEAAALGS